MRRTSSLSMARFLQSLPLSSAPYLSLSPSFLRPVSTSLSNLNSFQSNPNPGQDKGQTQQGQESQQRPDDEEFQPLDILKSKFTQRGARRKRKDFGTVAPPRYLKMPVDQDWGNVWPTARTFHPASVPLPLHQGWVPPQKRAPPNKWGNLELMKIPNFLHLTPPVVKRQCEALKKFCTPWPQELKDNAVLEELFPIEITTNDYCHSLPTIRDFRSRIVTLQIRLSTLNFDYHAKDKFLRLVGKRYDPKTDLVTLTIENCPLRKQNYDYAIYLMTALTHEAWNKEKWEDDKADEDMEKYIWDGSASQETVDKILGLNLNQKGGESVALMPTIEHYRDVVTKLHNEGEDLTAVEEYGKSVREILNLPSPLT